MSSAFKSTSRRGNANSGSEDSPKKGHLRRSQSVSALSRAHPQLDVSSEFLYKRDNPLFSSTGSPPDIEIDTESSGLKFADIPIKGSGVGLTSKTGSADSRRERGRSVTRNSDVANNKVAAGGRREVVSRRSLSRVDTGQSGRSVSRGHYSATETEERDSVVSSNYGNRRGAKSVANTRANCGRNAGVILRKSTQPGAIEPSDNSVSSLPIPNWEDGISTGSLSEAEEKTIKAVCEQMKSFQGESIGGGEPAANGIYETVRSEVRRAISDIQNDLESAIRRNNGAGIAATNVAVPSNLVDPGDVELVLDIRREYARKLEESQERARKLRSDLAVEEHRGQELSRILKEISPDPKTTNAQKSRPGRKNSNERKKMTKSLTEEAMAYFDECVSISTLDSSDFSAPEDQLLNSSGATASLAQESPSIATLNGPNSCLNHKQGSGSHGLLLNSPTESGLTASSSSNEPMIYHASLRGNNAECGKNLQFSLSQRSADNLGLQQDIRNYIRNVERTFDKDAINSEILRSNYYDIDEYLHGHSEGLLFDRILLKNRIDSGSLHLCSGSLAVSFSAFGSVI